MLITLKMAKLLDSMKLWNFPTHNKWFDEPEVMGFLTTTLHEVDIPAERC